MIITSVDGVTMTIGLSFKSDVGLTFLRMVR